MAGKELLVFLSKSKAEAYVTELPIKICIQKCRNTMFLCSYSKSLDCISFPHISHTERRVSKSNLNEEMFGH